jgi:valyl-tRNA synthetase
MQLAPSEKTELLVIGKQTALIEKHQTILTALTPTSKVTFTTQEPASFGASAIVNSVKLIIPIPESFRLKEKLRLEKEKEKLEKLLESTQLKLSNADFRSKAPREIVEKLESTLSQTEKQLSEVSLKLQQL